MDIAPRTSTLRLGHTPQAVRRAREHVRALCKRWRAEDVTDPAVLVTSELVTNAIVHGEGDPQLTVELTPGALTISVGDDRGDAGATSPQAGSTTRESGRGLFLVDAMTEVWGVRPRPNGGKVVWAALTRRRS